jgi:hypothetical protein
LLAKGIEVRLLLCEFVHHDPPKCRDTQHALWVLFGAPGAERLRVRLVRPKHGVFPTLHSKTWCADGEVYYGGSFAFRRNHFSFKVDLVVIRDPLLVRTREKRFRELWDQAPCRVAETVLSECRSRFCRIWYPADEPLEATSSWIADPVTGGPLDAFGSSAARAADESSTTSSPRSASEVPVRAASGSSP